MTQKEEIIRWVDCPDGTGVWVKVPEFENIWDFDSNPNWFRKDAIYIVDDKWAEIRKAFVDGKIIQTRHQGNWVDSVLKHNSSFKGDIAIFNKYRIKPYMSDNQIHEWQWYYYVAVPEPKWMLSGYATENEFRDRIIPLDAKKFEPSRRLRSREIE